MSTYFRSDGWVKSSQGSAIPGAQVFVCLQPANAPTTLSAGPPSPLADVFSDPDGLVRITLPCVCDGFGHYNFYILPQFFTLLIYNAGRLQQVYPDQYV